MSVSHRYRNFGDAKKSKENNPETVNEKLEAEKLEAFDAGYQAGWDDAVKAHAEEKSKLSAELTQNLQDMSFGYHEALAKLTVSIEPIMGQIIEKLLPEMVRVGLGARITEQVHAAIKQSVQGPVEIVVHSANVPVVEAIAEGQLQEPFKVVGEPSLGAGQAFVRVGNREQQIDFDGLVSEVSKAMTAFFHEASQEITNERSES